MSAADAELTWAASACDASPVRILTVGAIQVSAAAAHRGRTRALERGPHSCLDRRRLELGGSQLCPICAALFCGPWVLHGHRGLPLLGPLKWLTGPEGWPVTC